MLIFTVLIRLQAVRGKIMAFSLSVLIAVNAYLLLYLYPRMDKSDHKEDY